MVSRRGLDGSKRCGDDPAMIVTDRLRLRPWTLADLPFAMELWGDPEVTRLIDARTSWDEETVRQRLEFEVECLREHGVQYWLMERYDGTPVGCAGLHPVDRDDAEYELGFHVVRSEWRNGFAREAARAVLIHAFGELEAGAVFAGHHPENQASAALLEQLGFQRVGEDLYPPTGLVHPSYLRRRPAASGAQKVYDLVAEQYVEKLAGELDGKPFDRGWLEAFAARQAGQGPVCDLGCGPGHVTRYLKDAGLDGVFGLDLSPGMIEAARRRFGDLSFAVGNMDHIDAADDAWAAAILQYSIVNRPTSTLPTVFAELARVVRPGGELLIAFHLGGEVLPTDEFWGHEVLVDFVFHDVDEVVAHLEATGWTVTHRHERASHGLPIEYPSRRAYLTAVR
jgi:RimJ/RimL family protein N-acetyltransferase/ubiquinone/menaquinone biosynthesis C-methylase UbiE